VWYNPVMPNAETHLAAACNLLAQPEIKADFGWLAADAPHAAFLLGSISPDARAISGQAREATHFFTIPPADTRPAPDVMLADWPALAAAHDTTQAAFIAGYMTHLIMDQAWVEMIVMPSLFIDDTKWNARHPNWRLYCILMTYLEYRAGPLLPAEIALSIAGARPKRWLPFVGDFFLRQWGGHVARIIQQGGPRLLSSGLVKTCRMQSDEMEAIVLSESGMADEAYPTVPRDQIAAFEAETAWRSRDIVIQYLSSQRGKASL